MYDDLIVEVGPELDVTACADVFVAAFAAEPWNERWPVATVRKRLAEILACPGGLGLAAVVEGGCVGFVAGHVESFHPNDRFQLAEMAVRPSHQRNGVGSALIRGLLDRLAVKNVNEIFLITARGESPEAFWRSQSFVISQGRSVMVHRRVPRRRNCTRWVKADSPSGGQGGPGGLTLRAQRRADWSDRRICSTVQATEAPISARACTHQGQ